MKTILPITLFIFTGIATALFIGFDLGNTSETIAQDDEQEGIKENVVINFSHVVAENTPKGKAARKFADLVEERTNGKVSVKIFSNGSLYNDQNEYQALKDGRVQMIAPATSKLTTHFPEWQVLDLPFAFPSHEAVWEAFQGEIGTTLLDDLHNTEIKGLDLWYNGFKQITTNEKAILSPSDFNRKHFRIMPSPAIEEMYNTLEASTSTFPFNKTYKNLEVDFIDGQENTISNIYTKKLYKEQSSLTLSNHGYLGYAVLINREFWNNLSSEVQQVIKETLTETTDWVRRHSIEINDSYKRKLALNSNLDIHYLTNQEEQAWKEAIQPVYEEVESKVGQDLMNEVYRLKEKYEQ
ncbi:DctP family TRAP transporter solute-binding subunit [Pontibacillus yanchengensis]|uniref:C4-dicarboxylate ABC transporter n=1 Tax=Pontibacillus yanchengensis Y32 TaxID=1385514 RepID=A0A0A2TF42_9BACI|nr:DctP family TRAP transporter solute-binding subunit [Pontibacillus yanchengensis]KGP74184.1 C4-dicarboxylate ABC transporter [Pontibacillus yanchengensis Y32]